MMKSSNISFFVLYFYWILLLNQSKNNMLMIFAQEQSVIITCEDGTECQNGSTCIPFENGYKASNPKNSPTNKRLYRCDCTQINKATKYAGFECEFPADDYCLFGTNVVDAGVSFCVNGGECRATTGTTSTTFTGENDIEHSGCDCKSGFEGDFCEYLEGEAPVKVGSQNNNVIGLAIALVIISIVGLSVLGGLYVRRWRRASRSTGGNIGTNVSSSFGGDIEKVKVHQTQAELT